jgi:hypothetical protein
MQQVMQQVINRTYERKRVLDLHWLSDDACVNIKVIVQDLHKAYLINPEYYVYVVEYLEAWLDIVKQNPQFQLEDIVRLKNILYKLKYFISVPTLLYHELSHTPQTQSMECLWQCRTMNIQSQLDISMVLEFIMYSKK